MKSITLFISILLFSVDSFAQLPEPVKPTPLDLRNDYLKKSKSQETTAWILLGGGAALFTTGAIVFPKGWDIFWDTTPEEERKADLAGALIFAGSITMLSSIPLFIASGKNRRRGNNITGSLIIENSTSIQKKSFAKISFPAFSLKLNLK